MKRILAFLALASCAFAGTWISSPGKGSHAAAGGGGGGNEAFSDTFTGTGALSASWTNAAGGGTRDSDGWIPTASAWAENVSAYTGTACDTTQQYVKITLGTAGGGSYPGVIFRYTNASSPMYQVFMWSDEDQVTFVRKATAGDASPETVQTVTGVTIASGQAWGWTIAGSGSSVVIRGWLNPTGDTPTSSLNWGGDTTPDVTLNNNPTTPVDTGNFVGIGGEVNNLSNMKLDNFFGGDAP